jgi:ribonucleoside-triphosphate reductase
MIITPEQRVQINTERVQVIDRNGDFVPFDINRIENAVAACFRSCNTLPAIQPLEVVAKVYLELITLYPNRSVFQVELIEKATLDVLSDLGLHEARTRYEFHRQLHAEEREVKPVPKEVKEQFQASKAYFPTLLQEFQFFDKYSRYNEELGRRETWVETVDRTVDFLKEISQDKLDESYYQEIRSAILKMEVMPSMRLLAMAGPAARRNNISLFNCSFQNIDNIEAYPEALLISMNGCGVGYSVEWENVSKLPRVVYQREVLPHKYRVPDTTEGWVTALRFGLYNWFNGMDVEYDFSEIRPAGAPLKTKGGTASGPQPLENMLIKIREIILNAQGRKIRPLEAHDMMCLVGDAAVMGGTRRTAMISLFDDSDKEMLHCKDPENCHSTEMYYERTPGNWVKYPDNLNTHRWNANNSVVLNEEPSEEQIEHIFRAMTKDGTGEPGIFNRYAMLKTSTDRRKWTGKPGTNPCGEIILNPMELCNLSAAVLRAGDSLPDLARKVCLATIIGTIQSMATNFPGLRKEWSENCNRERLLGVDITGEMDNPELLTPRNLEYLKELAVDCNQIFASDLGIEQSAAVTCVKPSGNTSVLVNCASGLHPRYAQYYIRNVRTGFGGGIYRILHEAGVPIQPEAGQTWENCKTIVASFPVKSPEGAVVRHDLSVVDQLEHWLKMKTHWTEHNPSVSIYYRQDEIETMIEWCKAHRDKLCGLAFFPKFDGDASLPTLPYVEITEERYNEMMAKFPTELKFHKLYQYENADETKASGELACTSATGCEY